MKKVLGTSFLMVILLCCSFLLFACGEQTTIDKSGDYHVVSEEELSEVTTLITSLNDTQTNIKFYYDSQKIESGVTIDTNINGVSDVDYNLSFNVNIGASGSSYSQSVYYNSLENICYLINYDGTKSKTPLSPTYDMLANNAMSTSNIYKTWNEKTFTQNDIKIAKARGKIKIKIEFTDSTLGERGELYYEFLDDGSFVSYSYDSSINKDGVKEYLNIDLEATNKVVEVPSDLGSYN